MNGLRPTGPGPRPPEGGFANALRAARRRRWRTLGTGAACGTAAFATLVVTALPPTGSTAGLEPAAPGVTRTARPPAPVAAGTTPPPAPAPAPPDGRGAAPPAGSARAGGPGGSGGPAGGAGGGSGGGPAGGAVAGSPRAGGPAAAPPPPGSSAPPATPQDGYEPIVQTYEDQSVSAPCDDSTGWCLRAEVLGGDASRTLRLHACRGPSDTKGVLSFTQDNEADFTISGGGTPVWRWSWGAVTEPYPHDVPVDRWQCGVWSTPWNGADQEGNAVPAGQYTLSAVSTSSALETRTVTATFAVG